MDKYQYNPIEKALLEKSPVPYAIYQLINKRVVSIILSEGFCRLFGLKTEEAYDLMNNDMYRDTHPDDKARAADAAFLFATEDTEYNVAYRCKIRGEYRIIHALGEHIYTEDGVRLAVIWYTDEGLYRVEGNKNDDVLNQAFIRVLDEETKKHKILYDTLTGLPNKIGFFELSEERRASLWAEGIQPAIVIFNLNGMKYYNRKFGYKQGDDLLQKFGKILAANFGNDNCSHYGIDLFAALTPTDNLEDKLQKIFSECSQLDDKEGITVRAGIALDDINIPDLSIISDRAKYACDKNRGTLISTFSYFTDATLDNVDKYQYVVDNIDKAIENRWIQVYYQPIIRTANGRVCDEEALARWVDPVRGFLVPSDFIPTLENAKLIYKLDLFMVEQIIEKIKIQEQKGLHIVPISINLSRNDFDVCDIVEEIRRRVDQAGISHDKLTIEITESAVGSDLDFIKTQVDRFQTLGFKVWMDDFGSGYSSLDVLQSIHFDLIKFDMRFLQRFDQGDESKIILTELIKMAIGLGIDTLSEGVETAEQVAFLKEVGCTKLQGYFFCKPISIEKVFERYETGTAIGFENPQETDYYSALGRINLYDMALMTREDQESFRNYFDTLPMTVLESTGNQFRMIRCNRSFREFINLMKWNLPIGANFDYDSVVNRPGLVFMNIVRRCGEDGNRAIIDDVMPNGSNVHAFIKRIAVNPVTGTAAIAIAILGVTEEKNQNSPLTFAHIAQALSSDYFNLFYVNLETDDFIQYNTDGITGNIAVERHGHNFFSESAKDALNVLYKPDQKTFITQFTKENVVKALTDHGAFTLTYRQMYKGKPVYVNLKAVRINRDSKFIIIGVNNIDAQMKQQEALERVKQERLTYSRISALSGDLICIYTVDPETDHYLEYSSTEDYEELGLAKEGDNFFEQALKNSDHIIYEEDIDRFHSLFSKKIVLNAIRENKIYGLRYRLMIDGKPKYVSLKGAMVEEKDGARLIFGVHNIDARLKRDNEFEKNISIANAKVNIDPLTGVKNKYAYDGVAEQLDEQINDRRFVEFAVTVFGMKNLLNIKTNSSQEEENKWIKEAAETICEIFKRSPVFRLGNDEFAVISQGTDYIQLEFLINRLEHTNEKNAASNGIIIPFGTAKYDRDLDVKSVYKRAIENLKENYHEFKTVWFSSEQLLSKEFLSSD